MPRAIKVDFRNTMIVLTSNLAAEAIVADEGSSSGEISAGCEAEGHGRCASVVPAGVPE